tara:strand:- start:362 stop:997 length:636 start_codon:yes stop_codon:yes gene_type:complete
MSIDYQKPLLRGITHLAMFFISLIACYFLIYYSNSFLEIAANTIYSIGLCGMFGISALYHRLNCSIKTKLILRKLDHCGIFVMIAGSFTPICLLALPNESGAVLLAIVWSLAFIGIIQSIFFTRIHRWIRASLYLIVGYMAFPFIKVLYLSLSLYKLILIGAGGVVYSLGAIGYGLKVPKLNPKIFGFHEMFHLLVVIAAILHFIAIYSLI